MESLYIASQIYPFPPPLYGSNWGHKIVDFVFLPYISFIIAFTALECIKRYWETICGESNYPGPPPPPHGANWGHKIADLILLPYISFIIAFTALEWNSYKESLDSRSDLPPDPLLWVNLGS